MARRSTKSKPRRRRFTGVNLVDLAETVTYANIASQTLFNLNAMEFLQSKQGYGSRGITLKELGQSLMGGAGGVAAATASAGGFAQNAFGAVGANLRDNATKGLLKMAGVGIMFRIGKRVAAPARTRLNRGLKQLGLGAQLRV